METTHCQYCQQEIPVADSLTLTISVEFKKSGKQAKEELDCCHSCAKEIFDILIEENRIIKSMIVAEPEPLRKLPRILRKVEPLLFQGVPKTSIFETEGTDK